MSRSPSQRFSVLTRSFLEASWALFPHEASALGLHHLDAELGDNSPQTWQSHGKLIAATLRELENLPDNDFVGDDWLDRRELLSQLRTGFQWNVELQRWRNNPQIHCDTAIDSIFSLVIRNSHRLAAIQPAIESRLAKIPAFLAQGAACLQAPVPLWTRLARKSCENVDAFLKDVATQLAPFSPEPDRLHLLARNAIEAFAKYARAAENKTPGPTNGFAIGREKFELLIREKTGLSYSLPEVQALGLSLVEKLSYQVATESKKFGRKKAGQIIEEAAARWAPQAGSLLESYQRITTTVRRQFERANVVSFPKGEHCKVLPVPAFLKHHFPTAAYSQPGPFDKQQTGIFWVNDMSAAQSDPAKRLAEVGQHFGMEFTCAHEAYPGHHLQFVIQNQHPSHLRRLSSHAIFYEGWTLWCEKMAVDQAVIDFPEAHLIQLHDALWRAHRIGIDCGLQAGTLNYGAACRHLQSGVGFTAARARGDVNWYTSAPTVPMSYLLGRLEVERLHRQLVGSEGWSLLEFNNWILSFGAIPWSWIWDARLRQPRN